MHRPNYTSPTAPGPVNVTFHEVHTVYIYRAWKLWTAYGIAILLSAIVVLVGLVCMWLNGACYSNRFSTLLRVARGAEISVPIFGEDLSGRDPLPGYLSRARVEFGRGRRELGVRGGGELEVKARARARMLNGGHPR
jgi:hypothetical protein